MNSIAKNKGNALWRLRYPERQHGSLIKYKYGLTIEDYKRLLRKQNYRCAICRSKDFGRKGGKHFCIDHDHKTGKIRGLLCGACNKGLGLLKDKIKNLRNAIEYLQKVGQL